jgi:arginyl-tRNA synthetase
MSIDNIISQAVSRAVNELYGIEVAPSTITPQATRKEFEGNTTIVVFPWVKAARKAPEAVATEIGEWLKANEPAVAAFNVVKGFLNLTITPTFWCNVLGAIEDAGDSYGRKEATADSPLVMVEYSSPNTNKPLHLGHVRNNLLGYSLSEILKACGNRVVKTNIVNDRGIHICKSMLAWQKWANGATPESAGVKGDHLIGDCYVAFDKHYKAELKELKDKGMTDEEAEAASTLMKEARQMLVKWEQKDPEVRQLWQMMNSWVYAGFDETYKRMGVDFDKIYYESDTYLEGKEKVLEGLEKGIMYRKEDGSVWADLTGDGLDHKLLLRSDGTSVYMTQDIGTAKLRFADYPIDKMIYVVGNEQNYHFQVLSLLLDKLGFKWGKDLVHFSYGMVELPEGKMKSREGTVVDADDLMQEMVDSARQVSDSMGKLDGMSEAEIADIAETVGLGALKYTYARIRSVLRRSQEAGFELVDYSKVEPNEKEISLIQRLSDYPSTVAEAGRSYSPALIANYAYELVKEYNQFYHDYSILREEDAAVRSLRLALSEATSRVVRSAMSLLGIRVPERM